MDFTTELLIVIVAVAFFVVGYFVAWTKMPQERKDATKRSRSILTGEFSEQLAPYLPDFPFSPTEIKFMGKPIDFLVFKGMDEKNISEVVFLEVKSGKSHLNTNENSLRTAIDAKRVSWREYRIPENITKRPEHSTPA